MLPPNDVYLLNISHSIVYAISNYQHSFENVTLLADALFQFITTMMPAILCRVFPLPPSR